MKNILILSLLGLLSITSIVLHSINLVDHHNGSASSIVSLVFLGLMFITPWLKKLMGDAGEWIFIVVGVGSLVSQGYAYGEHLNMSSNVITGIALLSTLTASFLGHFLKEKPDEVEKLNGEKTKMYMRLQIAKASVSGVALVLLIIHSMDGGYTSDVRGIIVITVASLIGYITLGIVRGVASPGTIKEVSIETICGPTMKLETFLRNMKILNIILGAAALGGISILLGYTVGDAIDIINLVLMVGALVIEHVSIKYFRGSYDRVFDADRRTRRAPRSYF